MHRKWSEATTIPVPSEKVKENNMSDNEQQTPVPIPFPPQQMNGQLHSEPESPVPNQPVVNFSVPGLAHALSLLNEDELKVVQGELMAVQNRLRMITYEILVAKGVIK